MTLVKRQGEVLMRRRLRGAFCFGITCFLTVTGLRADETEWNRYVDQFHLNRQQGNFAEAEKAGLAAIAEAERSPRQSDLAASWNNLGALYYDTGRYAEAEKLFEQALHLWDNLVLTRNPEVGRSMGNLALLYLKTGRHKEAEALLTRVLESREKTL